MKAEDILNNKIEREYDRQVFKTVSECYELIRLKMNELRGYHQDGINVYHKDLQKLIENTNSDYNGFHKGYMGLKVLLTSLFEDVERNGKERIGERIIKKVEEFFHDEKEL